MAKNLPPIQRLTDQEMRDRFNRSDCIARVKAGELIEHVLENRHPSLMAANEPHCTLSQIVSYRDRDGNEIARVHQYLRTDKSLGASGRPDPKRLFQDGILYRLIKKRNREKAANLSQGGARTEP